MSKTTTLADGLAEEIERARDLLSQYRALGPRGQFGAAVIDAASREGVRAQASGDVIRMMQAYDELSNLK